MCNEIVNDSSSVIRWSAVATNVVEVLSELLQGRLVELPRGKWKAARRLIQLAIAYANFVNRVSPLVVRWSRLDSQSQRLAGSAFWLAEKVLRVANNDLTSESMVSQLRGLLESLDEVGTNPQLVLVSTPEGRAKIEKLRGFMAEVCKIGEEARLDELMRVL